VSDVAVAGGSPAPLTLGGTAGTPATTAAVAGSAAGLLTLVGSGGTVGGTAAVAGSSALTLVAALAGGTVATRAAGGWAIGPVNSPGPLLRWEIAAHEAPWTAHGGAGRWDVTGVS